MNEYCSLIYRSNIGFNCSTDIDECGSNPCQNKALCKDGVNNYKCDCAPGFTGLYCETGTIRWYNSFGNLNKKVSRFMYNVFNLPL